MGELMPTPSVSSPGARSASSFGEKTTLPDVAVFCTTYLTSNEFSVSGTVIVSVTWSPVAPAL